MSVIKFIRNATLPVMAGVVLTGCALAGAPFILSGYGSRYGPDGGERIGAHPAIDIGAEYGELVLAAADGKVLGRRDGRHGCGVSVYIQHQKFNRYTVYCHLERYTVVRGQEVKRGELIGFVGTSGSSGGVAHVHFELCSDYCVVGHRDGNLAGTSNPLDVIVGCFDPQETYPTDRLVLTFPVPCGPKAASVRAAAKSAMPAAFPR